MQTTQDRPAATLPGLDTLFTIEELSDYLSIPVKTLYDWRQKGTGPASMKLGRHLRYTASSINAWLIEQQSN